MVDFGNALMQISAATNGAGASADYNNDLAKLPILQQQAVSADLQNQQQAGVLKQYAALRQAGVTDPMQYLKAAATYNPDFTEKAASIQAQNPLASLLQNNSGSNSQQPTSLTGDDFLKTLPPAIASQVKGIATGSQQLPTGMGGAANRQALLQLVNTYDPSFDAVNYNARANTRKDFTSGKSAQNITALNTAMGHLSSLSDAYDSLGNGGSPLINTATNAVQNALGYTDAQKATQKATSDVSTDAHAVSEELAKVFRSTGMAESDVKAWEKNLSTSASPTQSKAIIGDAIELMNSRLDSLGQQYNQGMGTTKNGIELLSPKAQQAYQKLTGNGAPQTNTNEKSTPSPASITPEQARAELARRKAAKN